MSNLNMMSKQEVCSYFGGISIRTLNNWVNQGRLPRPNRVGREVYFFRSSVETAADLMKKEAEKGMLKRYARINVYPE